MRILLLVLCAAVFVALMGRKKVHFLPDFHWAKNQPYYIGQAPAWYGGIAAVDKCSVCGKKTVY